MKGGKSITILSILLFCSCQKERETQLFHLSFSGSLSSEVKSWSALTDGVKSTLYLFNDEVDNSQNLTPTTYLTVNNNSLTPTTPLNFEKGVYSLYSLSHNSSELPIIAFNGHYTTSAKNGKEYLWVAVEGFQLKSDKELILNYRRLASKVTINLSGNSAIDKIELNWLKFSLPQESTSTLNLKSGQLNSSSLLPPTIIEGEGESRQFIVIPSSLPKEIELSLNLEIGGSLLENQLYNLSIEEPFLGGYHYQIVLEVMSSSSIMVNTIANDWQIINNQILFQNGPIN